jgi:geranylgeranyl reductase family protein
VVIIEDMVSASQIVDVCVVGGGPSGVITAITVAKNGYSVSLVDKKSRDNIGDKTCGDAIDRAAFQRLKDTVGIDLPSGKELSDHIYKMSVAATDINTKISLDAPGFLVDRLEFGQRLLKTAEELGVNIIDSATVREIHIEKENDTKYLDGVSYTKDGKEHRIRAKFTIDASGAYAVIRRKLPDDFLSGGIKHKLDDSELWPSYREIIELNADQPDHAFGNEIILKYDKNFPPPGYFWIFSKGKRQLNVGIGWLKTQKLGPMKELYLREMEKYYPRDSYTVIKQGGGQIPFRIPFDNLVFNGGALVGDAAAMVHPMTAEGHGPALDTAQILGNVLIKALKSNKRDREILWEYNTKIASHYGRKHAEAELMLRLITKIGVSNLEFLIKKQIFREEEMNLIFSGGTLELTFFDKIKRILKIMIRPKILIALGQTFSAVDRCKSIYGEYPSNSEGIDEWRVKRNKLLNMQY